MLQEKDEYLRRRNLSSARTRSQDEDTFQMDEELFNLEEDSRSTNTGSSEEAGKGHRRSWSFGSINGNYRSGTVNSNTVNSKFHLIQKFLVKSLPDSCHFMFKNNG